MTMTIKKILVILFFSLFLIQGNSSGYANQSADQPYENALESFYLSDLNTATIHLKNALVQSNVSLTVRHGKKLLNHLQKINTEDLSNKQKNTLSSISKITNTITTINDLEKQRASFKLLSSAFVDLVSTSKTMDQSIYIQFCPMADQNKGANWLSFEKEIRNPYFGDSMLKCGRITKEIK